MLKKIQDALKKHREKVILQEMLTHTDGGAHRDLMHIAGLDKH